MSEQINLFPIPELPVREYLEKKCCNKPRLRLAIRNQMEIKQSCLDLELDSNHRARLVWDYVSQLDLSKILNKIKSLENIPGASTTDPRIMFSLWLYAFTLGIVSARLIAEFCKEHIGFKWICGNVSVNHHSISDFSTSHGEAFDDLLVQSVAVLMSQNLVSLDEVAQDGMKIEANAGKSSFRREASLEENLKTAEDHLKHLKKELVQNPNAYTNRQAAAKKEQLKKKYKG